MFSAASNSLNVFKHSRLLTCSWESRGRAGAWLTAPRGSLVFDLCPKLASHSDPVILGGRRIISCDLPQRCDLRTAECIRYKCPYSLMDFYCMCRLCSYQPSEDTEHASCLVTSLIPSCPIRVPLRFSLLWFCHRLEMVLLVFSDFLKACTSNLYMVCIVLLCHWSPCQSLRDWQGRGEMDRQRPVPPGTDIWWGPISKMMSSLVDVSVLGFLLCCWATWHFIGVWDASYQDPWTYFVLYHIFINVDSLLYGSGPSILLSAVVSSFCSSCVVSSSPV